MRSTQRTVGYVGRLRVLDRGTVGDVALVCLADVVVGASFGAVTVGGGLPWWVPVAMSVLVFAGGAQFAAIGVVLAGGSPAAAVLAGLVLNARLLPYGFAVADTLGRSLPVRLLGAHLVTDESTAFTIRQSEPERRRAVFWLSAVGLFVCWNLAVVAGGALGRLVPDTDTLGLDAAFPAVVVALVVPALKDGGTRRAAAVGALLALVLTPLLPPGLPVLASLLGLLVLRAPGRTRGGAA